MSKIHSTNIKNDSQLPESKLPESKLRDKKKGFFAFAAFLLLANSLGPSANASVSTSESTSESTTTAEIKTARCLASCSAPDTRRSNAPPIGARAEFRAYLSKIAENSETNPIRCVEKSRGEAEHPIFYKLTISDEPRYEGAFFVGFQEIRQTPMGPEHEWSTLIAYEGTNRYSMGSLKVTQVQNIKTYQHIFNGVIVDTLTLEIRDGTPWRLSYKTNLPGAATLSTVVCQL
jgi:hypothetical protein